MNIMNLLFYRLQNNNKIIANIKKTQVEALNNFRQKLKENYYEFENVPCLCGNKDSILISTTDRYALPVNTHLCKVCGLMWTSPRMQEHSLFQFYEEDYRSIYVGQAQAPDAFFDAQVQHGQFIYEFVSSHISLKNGIKVFDIGCGAGGVLLSFKESGWYTFGCDLGSEYLNRGISAGLVLEHGEASVLKKYGSANLVILSHVIEHFSNPLKTVKQISELLVDDGYIYVEVPGIFSIHKTYGDTLLFLQNAHLYHFSLASLTSLMAKAGFKIIKGDEQICALFQKCKNTINISDKNEFKKVIKYLYILEIKHFIRKIKKKISHLRIVL
jgi:SAM-dependent methyltransferase